MEQKIKKSPYGDCLFVLIFEMAGVAGLEPTHARIKIWCLTDLAIPLNKKMGWKKGLEPSTTRTTIWRSTN
jgi:hypothetical protein